MLEGYFRKMTYEGLQPVTYFFRYATYASKTAQKAEATLHTAEFSLNSLLGKKIKLQLSGEIRCVDCGRKTKKSFNQGSCYSCFTKLAKNDMCILRPNTCHYNEGTCREPEWGEKNCMQKHTVYLANTSGLKVGITKEKPVANRWVDQGAMFALPILEVESRKKAGDVEAQIARFVSDKTSWQKMISTDSSECDLKADRKNLLTKAEVTEKPLSRAKQVNITYPILEYPGKKKSYKPEKNGPIEDVLVGVKGQYLLFKNGVLNVRSYSGYHFQFEWE
ncbi:MAG: DUF2797 domain-containing protein [Spirochaetota bacterium]